MVTESPLSQELLNKYKELRKNIRMMILLF